MRPTGGVQAQWGDAVRTRLTAALGPAPGPTSVAVRLHDGRRVDVDAARVVPAASTIKVPVLVAALRACAAGRLELAAAVALPPAGDRVGGGGALELLPSVASLPLGEVLALMTCLSDNDATNAVLDLLDLVDAGAVARTLAAVPTRHTHLRRRLMDAEAVARGRQNTTTAADLADLLVALREGRLLDPAGTEVALGLLRGQQRRDGLPAYLPESVPVASKTGELYGVRCEVALVEPVPGRWAVVAVTATGLGRGGDPAALVGRDGSDRGTGVLPLFAQVGELVAGLLGGATALIPTPGPLRPNGRAAT